MSKLDTEKMLPDKPLQNGDKVSTVKKYVNKFEFALQWLLHESIDHRKVTVDSDTDWDDLKNYSVYYFNSLNGPHAPEENQIGSHEGIVVCSSAGIGNPYQFVLTKTGACFRNVRASWFYIGHGIPTDIDINKLVDQETLNGILTNYAKGNDLTVLKNQLIGYMAQTYTTLKQFNSGMSSADNHLSQDMSYENEIISANSYNDSVLNSSLSESTSANHSSDSYNISSNAQSLSYNTSSLSSQVNFNWESETGSVQPDGTYDVSSILSSGTEIPSLKSGTGSVYANTSNINSLNDTVSSESVINSEVHDSLSDRTSSLSSSASSASESEVEIYPSSSFISDRISYYNSLGDKISSANASFQTAISNYATTTYSSEIASYFFNSYSAADSYYNSCADYYKNLYEVSSQSDTQNLQDGSITSLSSGIGSVYANDSNLISLSNKVNSMSSADSGKYPHYTPDAKSGAFNSAITYLNNNTGTTLFVNSLDDDSPDDKVNDNKELASLNNDNIKQLHDSMDNATFIQVGSSSEPVTMYAAANSSALDSLEESQTMDNNTGLLVNSSYAAQYVYSEISNSSLSGFNNGTMNNQISSSSVYDDLTAGTHREGSIYINASNVNFIESTMSSSASQLSDSANSMITIYNSSDKSYEPYVYSSFDNVVNSGNSLTIDNSGISSYANVGSVAVNAYLMDSHFASLTMSTVNNSSSNSETYYSYASYDSLKPNGDSLTNERINSVGDVGSIAANASLIDSNHNSASTSISMVSSSANSSLNSLTRYTDNQFFGSGNVYPRMANDESAITDNYVIGSQNSTMINSAVGSMDSDGNTELSTVKVLCIARGSNANELNLTGHVIGYFVLQNPGNSVPTEGLPGVYNADNLNKSCGNNNAISYGKRGGTLNQFVGADGLVYHAKHSINGSQITENVNGKPKTITIENDDDIIDFTDVSSPVVERYCELVTPIDDVQARRIHDILAADDNYLNAYMTSVASSLITNCITSSENIGYGGGTVNIINNNLSVTSSSASSAVSSGKKIYSQISSELSTGSYTAGQGPASPAKGASNAVPASDVINYRMHKDLNGDKTAINQMKAEQRHAKKIDTLRNRIDKNLRE